MKYLIVYADDFGFTKGVNKACLAAYEKGIVTELSLMVDSLGTSEAIQIIDDKNLQDVGIHLTLSEFLKTGEYLRTPDYVDMLENEASISIRDKVFSEFSEFEKLIGRLPTHVTSHQGLHKNPKVLSPILEYFDSKKTHIPIRRAINFSGDIGIKNNNIDELNRDLREKGYMIGDYIFAGTESTYDEQYSYLLKELEVVKEGGVAEILLHPAELDGVFSKYTSLVAGRELDYRLALDENFRNEINRSGFVIVSHADLKSKV